MINKETLITCRIDPNDAFVIREVSTYKMYDLKSIIKTPINNFVDIGAHIGVFTMKAHAFAPNSIGYSFEPNKDNFEILKINTKNINNLNIYNKAIYGDLKPTSLIDCRLSQNNINVYNYVDYKCENEDLVYSIEKLQSDIGFIDILKIDCEGGEHSIFEKIDFSKIGYLLCEFHTIEIHRNQDFKPFFKWLIQIEKTMRVIYKKRMNIETFNLIAVNNNITY